MTMDSASDSVSIICVKLANTEPFSIMVTSDFLTSSDYLEEKNVLEKMTQKCTDDYSSRRELRYT